MTGKPNLLLSSLFLFSATFPAFSQTDGVLNEVQVSASRVPSSFNQLSRTVDVLDSAYIANAPATNLQQLLEYHAGVDIRTRGPQGIQSDISIRGSHFEQALILVNGVKVSDPQTGHHAFNLPVSLDDIARIEILKGSGARAFGQNAFSGAINIITKNPEQTQLRLRALYGQHNLHEINLGYTHVQEAVTQTISGTYSASDGYRHNTDFDNKNLFYTAQLKTADSKITLNAGVNDRSFGANGFYSDRFPDQWESTRTLFLSAGLQTSGKNTLSPRLYFRQHNDEFLLKRNEPSFYRNLHTSYVTGAEFNYTLPWAGGLTALGGELRNETLFSKTLGDAERQNAGLTAEHRFSVSENLALTPGVYANWTNSAQWQFFPGIDAGWAISPSTRAYASVNKSFRIPSFTELYYKDPANQGNPALRPEQAITYEAGFRFFRKGYQSRVAVFSRQTNNPIDWLLTENIWVAQNIGQVTTHGTEIQLGWQPETGSETAFLRRVDLQYAYLESESDLAAEVSKYVLDHLRHQVILGLDHRVFGRLSHSVKARFEDREIYQPYVLVDNRLTWRGTRYTAYLQANNLLGETYFEVGRIPMPGRWLSVGAELTLPVGKSLR